MMGALRSRHSTRRSRRSGHVISFIISFQSGRRRGVFFSSSSRSSWDSMAGLIWTMEPSSRTHESEQTTTPRQLFFRMLTYVIFCSWLRSCTNLKGHQVYDLFELFDVDRSGEIDFDEFYLVIAILVAVKDKVEKEFIYRHSRAVFNIMDYDQSGSVSAEEFERIGFMFNFYSTAIRSIFKEFDVSGDSELDFKEFKLFAMACIDQQRAIWLTGQRKQLQRSQLKFLTDNKELLLSFLDANSPGAEPRPIED